jgi:hypothetical protein
LAALLLLAGCAPRDGAADQPRHGDFYGGVEIGGARVESGM